MRVTLAAILGAVLLCAASAHASTIATRSTGSYGITSATPTGLGTDLSQMDLNCNDTGPSAVGSCPVGGTAFSLIVGVTTSVPSGTEFVLDLPSSFDGTFGLLDSDGGSTCSQGFALCTIGSSSSLASCITDQSNPSNTNLSGDTFTFTVTSSCPSSDLTFFFDENSPGGVATLGTPGGPTSTPEPETLPLTLAGLAALGIVWLRRGSSRFTESVLSGRS